jgi:hypothetical protein
VRADTATSKPAFASSTAAAFPMPREAPVTSATGRFSAIEATYRPTFLAPEAALSGLLHEDFDGVVQVAFVDAVGWERGIHSETLPTTTDKKHGK